MNLVVHIPDQATEECSQALSLAQRAPSFTVEWTNNQRTAVAIFPSLPVGIDLAVKLIGESLRLTGAWASVNAKPFSNLVRLWQRLLCYRDSLGAADPVQYCREKSAQFNALAVCAGHCGVGLCQFIFLPSVRTMSEGPTDVAGRQYEVAAMLAEIDWCPNLKLPARVGHEA